jgi:Family of unknown function (DUF6152)
MGRPGGAGFQTCGGLQSAQKACAAVLLLVAPLLAHHSTAPFDMTHPFTISGVVTKFLWANPHSYIDLDVNGDHWRLEIEAVNLLRRYGWTKDSLNSGDKISCTGARAKDPATLSQKCFTVEFPDGRKLVATPTGEPPR